MLPSQYCRQNRRIKKFHQRLENLTQKLSIFNNKQNSNAEILINLTDSNLNGYRVILNEKIISRSVTDKITQGKLNDTLIL